MTGLGFVAEVNRDGIPVGCPETDRGTGLVKQHNPP